MSADFISKVACPIAPIPIVAIPIVAIPIVAVPIVAVLGGMDRGPVETVAHQPDNTALSGLDRRAPVRQCAALQRGFMRSVVRSEIGPAKWMPASRGMTR